MDVPEQEQLAVAALRGRALANPLSETQRRAWQEQFNRLPAMRVSGARVDLQDPHLARVVLEAIQPQHEGGLGGRAVNGAVIAGLFDCAIGVAGLHQLCGQVTGTVELSIKIMRPAKRAPLVFYAVATKKSTSLVFAESLLFSAGRLCAQCTGMVAASSRPAPA